MPSVRAVAASCLDVTGNLSIRRDVFGYPYGAVGVSLKLKDHLTRIRGHAINLSPILVGHDPGFPPGDEFTIQEAQRFQTGIHIMRELYAQVEVGVRKIFWGRIPIADAGDFTVVDKKEATKLTRAWSGDNDGIDVFLVTSITDAAGWSNVKGPCDKTKLVRTGAVVELISPDLEFGILLAHEVGHYLGLKHGNDIHNIMGTDENNDGKGETDERSVQITDDQGETMREHCSTHGPCGGSS
jgi:hypothetical protein